VTKVLVDTSAFVAMERRSEREHAAAHDALAALVERGADLIATSYVFAETYSTLLNRDGRWLAIQWGASMRSGAGIYFVQADKELEDAAWAILESHDDKDWSYVDAVSFALMEREGLSTAFAFGEHFRQRGLAVVPGDG